LLAIGPEHILTYKVRGTNAPQWEKKASGLKVGFTYAYILW